MCLKSIPFIKYPMLIASVRIITFMHDFRFVFSPNSNLSRAKRTALRRLMQRGGMR